MKKSWDGDSRWVSHSFACWDEEWRSYKEISSLVGAKSVNGWIRQWLNEAVKYERLQLEDRGQESLDV